MTSNERGTSLAELLLVLAIIGLITGALVGAIYQIFDVTGRGNSELLVQHDLQNAATWLNRDVLSASLAKVDSPTDGIYEMTLEVPYLSTEEEVTTTIHYVTYTYYEETGDLTRDSGDSPLTIARHIIANPFPPLGTEIEAPDPVTVTLRSRDGNVPGSGTFALKMRAGGFIRVEGLCTIAGDEHLDITTPVQWGITNNGGDTASIEQIIIAWPITNGRLTEIRFGGTSPIAEGFEPTSATIIKPQWLPAGDRTIDGGTPKTLEFWFEEGTVDDEDQYSIEITFDNGCIVPFP